MAADDKIRWQISMALPQNEVKRIMGEMKKQAHAELTKTLPLHFAGAKAEGKIPGKPSVQLQRVEEIGGKKYLFSLETFAKKVPHRSKETGKATLEDIDRGYRLSVKELRETTKKVLSEDAQRIRELKQKIKYQEKDVQKAEIEKFFTAGFKDVNNELKFRLNKINKELNVEKLAGLRAKIAGMTDPSGVTKVINRFVKNNADLVKEADEIRAEVKKRFSSEKLAARKEEWQSLKVEMTGRDIPEQISMVKDFAVKHRQFRPARAALRKLRIQEANAIQTADNKALAEAKKEFASVRSHAQSLDPISGIKFVKDYKKEEGALIGDANLLLKRLGLKFKAVRGSLAQKQFAATKVDITGREINDAIDIVQKHIADGLGMPEQAKALLRSLEKTRATKGRTQRKADFNSRLRDVQLLSSNDQIDAYTEIIKTTTGWMRREAILARRRARRNIQQNANRTAQDQKRNFANIALSAAGAGLGLLGPMGFPLLNVGFAAMSGGKMAAGIVGFTTALGEAIRMLDGFAQRTEGAARTLGFVPKSLKLIESRQQAIEAFAGFGALNVREIGLRRRQEDLSSSGLTGVGLNETWGAIKEATFTQIQKLATGQSKRFGPPMGADITFGLQGWVDEFMEMKDEIEATRLPKMESALKSARAQVFGGSVGVESDPYEVWKRIQSAAFDTSKNEELEIARTSLKTLEEMVQIERERAAREKSAEALPWYLKMLPSL